MKTSEVRLKFVDYFKRQGHQLVPSSRLVPDNDPTLLFVNSGMVQFKNVFLGFDKRPYTRATTAQKCVRAGGKHNDLDNVGHTARHHTFFEMMGNFSFGDYFKKEAIHFAWDLLTVDFKIPKEKLSVTVFRDDDEAFEIWNKQENVPAERISRFDEKDNFWQMADTGPCGPCSEIFYDHGPQANCPDQKRCKVGCSCDRFVEIWNLVFMQYNKDENGKLNPLPKPSVDTGAGLERLAAAMQKVASNYDTDIFLDLFKVIEKVSGKKYLSSQFNKEVSASNEDINVAMRVLADHSRAAAFLIADGTIPSNEGQGYVLRRIMRRGIRYGRKLSHQTLILPTVKEVIRIMGDFYPELKQRENFILNSVATEEERFLTTLDLGTELFNKAITDKSNITEVIVSNSGVVKKSLSGEIVFKLYDTFGFPADLTRIMAEERGLTINEAEFEQAMTKQKETAKASGKFSSKGSEGIGQLMKATQGIPATKFLGYDTLQSSSKVLGLYANGENVAELKEQGVLVVDQSPFYAEGGGQIGDHGTGYISGSNPTAPKTLFFEIHETKKLNDVFLHFVEVKSGSIKSGDTISLEVSHERRNTQRNHSATHLLHAALRKVLGDHISQAGSSVDPQRLRFDFTQPKPLTPDELKKVETMVNKEIARAEPVQSNVMNYKDAIKTGAMALFGEKYGDEVRVLKMGEFSTELCGGTHVHNTGDIRLFKILREGGVSSGVRRIEAITGDAAVNYMQERDSELARIEENLKLATTEPGKVIERIQKLQEQIKKLEKDLKNSLSQGQSFSIDDIVKNVKKIKDTQVVSSKVEISDRDLLSELSDKIKDKIQSGIVILIGTPSEESPNSPIVVNVTKNIADKFHAGNILKQVAAVMGGKGGGRPDFAQGSGPDASKAQEAIDKSFEFI